MQALSIDELVSAADLAKRAAMAAGERLLKAKSQWIEVDSQIGRDIKLRADTEAEAVILSMLREQSPYPILSEEAGSVGGPEATRPYWVVDPLDGTFNYLRDIPLCCVSIALCLDRDPLLGCIYDFNRDELFTGGKSTPLLCNGVPVPSPAEALILATGLPRKGDFSADRLARFGPHVAQWKQVRMIGSAALSLAWVAAGRFDAYEEAGILWWDVAAGVALVRAGGGRADVEGDVMGGILDVKAYRGAVR